MNHYLITIEKIMSNEKIKFVTYIQDAEDIMDALREVDNHPEHWANAETFSVISIHLIYGE